MSFLMSSSHLFLGLPCGRIDIGFHLHTFFTFLSPPFDVNGQTGLIVVLLPDLSYSYVLLIHLIHRLFWFSMYHLLFFVRPKIFLNTFLSNIINLLFMVSFKTHTSQAYVTVGHMLYSAIQYSTWSPFLTLLSRRAQSGRWSSFGKLVWFTESHIVLIISFLLAVLFTQLIVGIKQWSAISSKTTRSFLGNWHSHFSALPPTPHPYATEFALDC